MKSVLGGNIFDYDLGGLGACPPRNFLVFSYSETASGAAPLPPPPSPTPLPINDKAVGRGVQGVQLKPPSKLMIFMTTVMLYGKIDGRNNYFRSALLFMLIQHILGIS